MGDYIIIGILVAILGGIIWYLVRAKKHGDGCVGCPYSKKCNGCHGCAIQHKKPPEEKQENAQSGEE